MTWEEDREAERAAAEHLEAEHCALAYDLNETRRRSRRLLAITERLSVLPDALAARQTTPAEIRATIAHAEKAAHLLDDQLRFLVPRVAEALHLVIGRGCDDVEPW